MNIVLSHDRYTPVTPFVQMLKDVMAASNIEMYVEVVDMREVYRTMFQQHVDNGRFDKWFDSVYALNSESQNPLVMKVATNPKPDTCTIIVVDRTTDYQLEGTEYITTTTLAAMQEEVARMNPLETPQAVAQIVDRQMSVPPDTKPVDISNQKAIRKIVLEIIGYLA